MSSASPVALRVPLHHADAAADHQPAGGLLRDRSREHGANANPFTTAMLGFGKDSTRRVIWWPGRMKCATASAGPRSS
jgi:hypothetical protein